MLSRLLDGVSVACFDLFDTLIRVRSDRLPEADFGGTAVRSTVPILHERLLADRGIALADITGALRSTWVEIQAELRQEDGPDDERLREISAITKYRRFLERLDGIDPAEVVGLAEDVAELHHAELVGVSEAMEGAFELLDAVRARGIPRMQASCVI